MPVTIPEVAPPTSEFVLCVRTCKLWCVVGAVGTGSDRFRPNRFRPMPLQDWFKQVRLVNKFLSQTCFCVLCLVLCWSCVV